MAINWHMVVACQKPNVGRHMLCVLPSLCCEHLGQPDMIHKFIADACVLAANPCKLAASPCCYRARCIHAWLCTPSMLTMYYCTSSLLLELFACLPSIAKRGSLLARSPAFQPMPQLPSTQPHKQPLLGSRCCSRGRSCCGWALGQASKQAITHTISLLLVVLRPLSAPRLQAVPRQQLIAADTRPLPCARHASAPSAHPHPPRPHRHPWQQHRIPLLPGPCSSKGRSCCRPGCSRCRSGCRTWAGRTGSSGGCRRSRCRWPVGSSRACMVVQGKTAAQVERCR